VVDDNAMNLRLATDVLGAAGFRTLGAVSGEEGIELAARHLPDVILMDLQLPDMSGADAARALAEQPRTAPIPVVVLSAVAFPGDRKALLDAGFDGSLGKPIDVRAFPEQVRNYCHGRPA
jgi:CheY-like chemotaxis protein